MSEERWRNLFESVPVGVDSIDSHRRYVAANPAFQTMTGYSEAELLQPYARRHHRASNARRQPVLRDSRPRNDDVK